MIVGKGNFIGGQTLRKRVSPDDPAGMAVISGFDNSQGYLTPEGMVENLTGTPLSGVTPEQIPYAMPDDDGNLLLLARDADNAMREFNGGEWGSAGPTLDVPAEAVPSRYGPSIIYPTIGSRARLMAYEPGSTGTKARPVSMEDPNTYEDGEVPVLTPSTHPATQLFDMGGATGWAAIGGTTGVTVGTIYTDYQPISFAVEAAAHVACPASQVCASYDLGASGTDFTGQKYLVLDLILLYAFGAEDPATQIIASGQFVNGTALASGFEISLYSERPSHGGWSTDHLIRTYAIPALDTTGRVNRVLFHLGTLSALGVKALSINTASYFVTPSAGYWTMWFYSYAFDSDWEHKGNFLLPAVTWDKSPWQPYLPPDPGTDGTSAVVLETFTEAFTDYLPGRPAVRYAYCFAAKDRLSTTYHRYMTSNPTDWCAEIFADPWRTYAVVVTLPEDAWGETFITDYGDYGTHILIYRDLYTGTSAGDGAWLTGNEPFIQAVAIAASMTYTDAGVDADPLIGSVAVPSTLEITSDFAAAARFVTTIGRRVVSGCLGYDALTGTWQRKTAIQVSTYEKPWAFPTTSDEDSPSSEGGELDNYAQTGTELRGLLGRDDHVVVWLNNELFVLLGDSPSNWRFVRRGPVGLRSFRSVAVYATGVIWHAGDHFYDMTEGIPIAISEGTVDSSLIDWDSPHSAECAAGWYRFHCKYNGEWSVLTYHVGRRSWRIRPSDAYELVGICAPDASGEVYGVRPDGYAVSLFSGTEDYGAATTRREATTQAMAVAPPRMEVPILSAVFEVITEEANDIVLTVTAETHGLKRQTQSRELLVNCAKTSYEVKWDGLAGNAVAVGVTCAEARCPDFYFEGADIGEAQVA